MTYKAIPKASRDASNLGDMTEFSTVTEVTKEQVIAVLSGTNDPDRGSDIVSLGMVSEPTIREGHVLFSIEVDPRRGAAFEPVRSAAELAVRKLPGVLSVTAVLTAERAPDQGRGRQPGASPVGGGRAAAGQRLELPGIAHVVAVASGKGGVGNSTTAVNLALALSANGLKAGLLDADIYGPSMPRMMGISGKPATRDGKTLEPMRNYGIPVMSIGFMIDEETPMIWRGPMVQSAITQMIRDVQWGELDILVVDLPPGTGDAQLTMAQQVPLSGAVIVSTPQDIALLDARKGLNMFRKVDVPVLGIVENMSYFVCPNCGHQTDIFSHGGARNEATRLGMAFLGEIPLDIVIRETSDGGQPIVVGEPDGSHALAYRAIAANAWAALTGAAPRKAPPIVYV